MAFNVRRFNRLSLGILALSLALGVSGCQDDPVSSPGFQKSPKPTVNGRSAGSGMDNMLQTPTPSPRVMTTPTSSPRVITIPEAFDPCGPSLKRYSGELHEHFLHWTRDGAHLVFDLDDTIWTLDIEGARLQEVADVDSDYRSHVRGEGYYRFLYGFHADVSPDGSRIVYASCEYMLDKPFTDTMEASTIYSEGYELAAVNVDGTAQRRLTKTEHFDNYPAWSPDGTQIAFVAYSGRGLDSSHYPTHHEHQDAMKIAIMSSDAQSVEEEEIRWLWSTKRVALYPPVWSPDSQRLAFITNEGENRPHKRILYTIGSDGSEMNRIGETTALPTWSPDSEELAFAAVDDEEAMIYIVEPDGAGLRRVWSSGPDGTNPPISQVSWSPDGSELLFISDQTYVVGSDGGDLRRLVEGVPTTSAWVGQASWSPDGSRIAIHNLGGWLITVCRDATDLRVLIEVDANGRLRALNPPPPDAPADPAACSTGLPKEAVGP